MFTVIWYSGPAEIRDEYNDESAAIRRARYLCGYRDFGTAKPGTDDVVLVVNDAGDVVYDEYPVEIHLSAREIEDITSGGW